MVTMIACAAGLTGCMQPKVRVRPIYYPAPPATPHAVHLVSFSSLHEIAPPEMDFESLFTGGGANPSVEMPAGIAFQDGTLYVCDTGVNVVHAWPMTGQPPGRFGDGQQNDIRLKKPVDVAVADDGTVYVADSDAGQIVRFAPTGGMCTIKPNGDDQGFRPVGLAVHGSRLFVSDIGTHTVRVYSEDGSNSASFGGAGDEEGQFSFPLGVCLDPDGRIYVADTFNSRVQILDDQGTPLASMGQPGDRYGDMVRPRKVAVGPDGVIFIADPDFGYVHLFDDQGNLLMLLGGSDVSPGTSRPVGVAVADALPESITSLVPSDFNAHYFLFVADTLGEYSLSLYAIGLGR